MAIESGHVDSVWFVVSPESPYKTGTGTLALASHRYAMVVRACGYSGKFSVEDIEFRMEPPSYTYLTLAKLKERNPDYEFYFICGTDVYVDIPNWHGGKEVIDACKFLVYPRTTSKNYTPEDMADKTIFLNGVPNLEISATFLREQLKNGKTTKHLLPESVKQYYLS